MSLTDLPILKAIRAKMDWHQARQRVLSENVANADTPGYQAYDLKPLDFEKQLPAAKSGVAVTRTHAGHIAAGPLAGDSRFADRKVKEYDVTPDGNQVVLEEQMMKVAQNQLEYQTATALYTRSLKMLKTALSRNA
ncbi:MAG: flagellar basal body rod protein FlgB [Hyphomicrobiales bacterium]|nr:MAG: flagellar basal body rod protein FlgB [Hyphomicrobiales bacterium]